MCTRSSVKRKLGDMNIETFKKVIDSGEGFLEFVWLQDYGEPLLNKNIVEMVKYCKSKGVMVGISTNVTLLNKKISTELIDAGLGYIILSIDGVRKGTYERIRRGGNFESVVNNAFGFLDIKNKKKSDVFVVVQCILLKETEPEIPEFRRFWNRRGVNSVRIRTYSDLKRFFEVEDSKDDGKTSVRKTKPCFWLWKSPNIKWDGTLVPCCRDLKEDFKAGNINKMSLVGLWNSETMKNLRRVHVNGDAKSIPMCKHCDLYQPSRLSLPLFFLLDNFRLNKIIASAETSVNRLKLFRRRFF